MNAELLPVDIFLRLCSLPWHVTRRSGDRSSPPYSAPARAVGGSDFPGASPCAGGDGAHHGAHECLGASLHSRNVSPRAPLRASAQSSIWLRLPPSLFNFISSSLSTARNSSAPRLLAPLVLSLSSPPWLEVTSSKCCGQGGARTTEGRCGAARGT